MRMQREVEQQFAVVSLLVAYFLTDGIFYDERLVGADIQLLTDGLKIGFNNLLTLLVTGIAKG